MEDLSEELLEDRCLGIRTEHGLERLDYLPLAGLSPSAVE
jgi:hypothetical protein